MITAEQTTDDYIIRCVRIACRITKATGTHTEYVLLIASPLQQRLHERASMLRYTCISCLAVIWFCTIEGRAEKSTKFVLARGSSQITGNYKLKISPF